MRRTLISLLIALSVSGAALAADDISKVNGSAIVEAGQHAGDVHSVNGSVQVGDRAVVQKASTVNGAVELGESATATILKSVNDRERSIEDALNEAHRQVSDLGGFQRFFQRPIHFRIEAP